MLGLRFDVDPRDEIQPQAQCVRILAQAELKKLAATGRPFNRPLTYDFPDDPKVWTLTMSGLGPQTVQRPPASPAAAGDFVTTVQCESAPVWTRVNGTLVLGETGLCLDSATASTECTYLRQCLPVVWPCEPGQFASMPVLRRAVRFRDAFLACILQHHTRFDCLFVLAGRFKQCVWVKEALSYRACICRLLQGCPPTIGPTMRRIRRCGPSTILGLSGPRAGRQVERRQRLRWPQGPRTQHSGIYQKVARRLTSLFTFMRLILCDGSRYDFTTAVNAASQWVLGEAGKLRNVQDGSCLGTEPPPAVVGVDQYMMGDSMMVAPVLAAGGCSAHT